MKSVRRIIAEIHRRSLWQVLAIFAATGWGVLQVLDVLINHGILPAWVFKVGLVLLLIGLPVVMATAFVQEGVGGGAREPLPDDEELMFPESATRELRMSPAARQAYLRAAHHRLFTWRNALLGGLAAFTLLGFASAGYMGMRTLGIGAPGTLLAQGILAEGAPVLLADFESSGDAELAGVVTRTLHVDLLQSRVIRVLERADLNQALERMQRDRSTRIDAELAMELAEREGYAAIVTGTVAPAGAGYVLTASILGGEGQRALAAFRETARSDEQLVDAIERLSRSIRDKMGESLRSVRSSPSLAQVTTSSLPALRAYTRGFEHDLGGDSQSALEEYERAVQLDPGFAMAHRKVGVSLINLGIRRADARRSIRRAWELSDRLPELERHLTTGYYHARVSGDIDAAIRAYEQALRIDSTQLEVRGNLANAYRYVARYDDAARLNAGSLRMRPAANSWNNLAVIRFESGDYEGAQATLDSAMTALPGFRLGLARQAWLAASHGEYALADSLLTHAAADALTPFERTTARLLRVKLAGLRGRIAAAERALNAPGAELFLADSAEATVYQAELLLLRADTAGALRLVRGLLDEPPDDMAGPLMIATEAGDIPLATMWMATWRNAVPDDELGIGGRVDREFFTGQLARLRGDFAGALRALEALRSRCPGCGSFIVREIGRTHDDMGDVDSAIAAYEQALAKHDSGRVFLPLDQVNLLLRLAELYDARGDTQKALEYYGRFVDLRRDADPALQPRVRTAQARLQALLPDR
jgi:eukaryotic-like serine/threonine-protein kinase